MLPHEQGAYIYAAKIAGLDLRPGNVKNRIILTDMADGRKPPAADLRRKGLPAAQKPGERLPYLTKAGFSTGNIRCRREAKSVIMPDRDHGGR